MNKKDIIIKWIQTFNITKTSVPKNTEYLENLAAEDEVFWKLPHFNNNGIWLKNEEQLSYSSINLYVVLSLVNTMLVKNRVKKDKKIFLFFDKRIDKNIEKNTIFFLKSKDFFVYKPNYVTIDELITLYSIRESQIPIAITITYNAFRDLYVVKLYEDGKEINQKDYQQILRYLINEKHSFEFIQNEEVFEINTDKILKEIANDFNFLEEKNNLYLNETLNVATIIEDSNTNFFISSLLTNFNIKHTKLNPFLHNKITRGSLFFNRILQSKFRYDMVFTINKQNKISIYAKYQNKLVKLTTDQIIYFYLNFFFLNWKDSLKNKSKKLFIPIDSGFLVTNLVKGYRFEALYENEIKDNSNIIFGSDGTSFSHNRFNLFQESNLSFLLNFIHLFYIYKNSNTIFNYKYKKMLEFGSEYKVKTLRISAPDPEHLKENVYDFFAIGEKLSKEFQIDKIIKNDYASARFDHLLALEISSNECTGKVYLKYDYYEKKVFVKCEVHQEKFQRKAIAIYQFKKLINSLKNKVKVLIKR